MQSFVATRKTRQRGESVIAIMMYVDQFVLHMITGR